MLRWARQAREDGRATTTPWRSRPIDACRHRPIPQCAVRRRQDRAPPVVRRPDGRAPSQEMTPMALVGGRFGNMFSAMLNAGTKLNSWNTVPIPRSWASRGDAERDARMPSKRICTFVRHQNAGDHVHHGRFAGAIFADEGVHSRPAPLASDMSTTAGTPPKLCETPSIATSAARCRSRFAHERLGG